MKKQDFNRVAQDPSQLQSFANKVCEELNGGTNLYRHYVRIGRTGDSPLEFVALFNFAEPLTKDNIGQTYYNLAICFGETPYSLTKSMKPFPTATFISVSTVYTDSFDIQNTTINISDITSVTDTVTPL